jgi:hypothetical protein
VFCPNCGTQNDSAAAPCKKCGFKLSGISVPKFKGTMMLNSDQTVQELIEEHRRKQAQGSAAEKSKGRASDPAPKRVPGSSAPPSSLSGPRGPVLQPPRAAVPRGRMGGTMLGVAPQAGGVPPLPSSQPPEGVASGSAALDSAVDRRLDTLGASEPQGRPGEGPADPLAATAAQASVPPAPEPAPEPAAALDSPRASHTRPLAPTAALDAPSSASAHADIPAAPDADATQPAPADAEPPAAETQPPRNRRIAQTLALPQQPEAGGGATSAAPPGIGALDVVLIVCTLGLYGIVLWLKQRRRPA